MKLDLHDKAKLASDILAKIKCSNTRDYEKQKLIILGILQHFNMSEKKPYTLVRNKE